VSSSRPERNRSHRGRGDQHRPPWWPEGTAWPPQGDEFHRRAARFARRLGCALGCFLLILVGGATALVWLLLSAVGAVSSAPVATAVSAVGIGIGVIGGIALVVAARRLAVPVRGLVSAARRVETGDYSARVPLRGPGSLRSLARAFNAMSARLEAEETRRRSVLADIAHEMRTPLTVIRSQAEAIADGVNPADAEHLAPIVAATHALESLADDLRTLTLAEAGGLQLDREPVDVGVLVSETLDAFRPDATALGIGLVNRVAADTPAADADPARLRQVLGNLIANALAHTPRGGTVSVESGGETAGGAAGSAAGGAAADGLRLTVRDDGEGIPAELLPRVFDRFVKGPGSTGSGLGLAIVRNLVEAHGGTVTVESTEARGTAITMALPAAG
jgi:two-component system sensor histidine kinase BaeS